MGNYWLDRKNKSNYISQLYESTLSANEMLDVNLTEAARFDIRVNLLFMYLDHPFDMKVAVTEESFHSFLNKVSPAIYKV